MRFPQWKRVISYSAVLLAVSLPASANMIISVTAGSTMSSNTAAMAAFDRAVSYWEGIFADDITINISADFASLDSGILGSASTSILYGSYDAIRNSIVSDQLGYNTAVTSALPTSSQLSVSLPSGYTYNGNLYATRANMKALGLIAGDATGSDGSLTFSTNYSFDFDNSDGVTGIDFESVVVHEIGHILGFVSVVDTVDQGGTTNVGIYALDLYRFNTATAPTSTSEFTTAERELTPGEASVFSDANIQYAMATGRLTGDGDQASHWKADEETGYYIGVMDPTLAPGIIAGVTLADIYALDLIGYDTAVPEPATVVLIGCGMLALFRKRILARQ